MSNVELLRRDTYYPLGDYHSQLSETRERLTYPKDEYVAKWSGEFREPKKGEWYLSGAIITAYKAPNDLTMKYHIAEIVKVRRYIMTEEVKE